MHGGLSIILIAPAFNEEQKIGEVVRRAPRATVDEVLVVDDGSTDSTAQVARERGATVLPLGKTVGVGAAIRAGYQHALAGGYDVAVTIAGNNNDAPDEIPLLVEPIAETRADFVQASGYVKPRADLGRMPRYRRIATRIHPLLFSLASGRRVTESTNGFRAVHRRVLADPRIRLDQPWLDQYELEPYLYLRAIQGGFRTAEVPGTKIYPPRQPGQKEETPNVRCVF